MFMVMGDILYYVLIGDEDKLWCSGGISRLSIDYAIAWRLVDNSQTPGNRHTVL
jgi:hypothetical protein